MTKAVVLSGGGFAGGAWMIGLIDALRRGHVDLGEADLIVGTSAGARTAVQIATGALERSAETYRRSEVPALSVTADLGRFVAASMEISNSEPDEREAARRIANLGPLGATLVPDDEWRRVIATLVTARSWPARPRLAITAVDAASGERVVFDAKSDVDLHDALAASSALPGILPLAVIGSRRYADGGVHSIYNADLARGHDVVVVLSPMPLNVYLQRKLDKEIVMLRPSAVRVIVADEASVAAIGPNPMSPDRVAAAVAAGAAQCAREIAVLRTFWRGGIAPTPGG